MPSNKVATNYQILEWGWYELRYAASIKYTPDFEYLLLGKKRI